MRIGEGTWKLSGSSGLWSSVGGDGTKEQGDECFYE